ncbi:Vps62-related protein [Myxococcus sp. CA040A]|uniref:Vps62-related protein n=1 Tax=Myxococcus sp. CA040A TaxID=2741738 RepID=UPI00157BA1E3|nr:Vps62-related protein [Myxococcus sp. CA040A]NTX01026.1 Vps62-related protein [Myxococcus sp. CA040A]
MSLGVSLKSAAWRAVLLGGLLALSTGCQGEGIESDGHSESLPGETEALPVLQQQLAPLREKSCREIKNARPQAGDGEYTLHLMGDAARPWKAWCHDMAGTPTEYLPLPENGLHSNFSQYTAGGAAPGSNVRTVFSKLRINPVTLEVDTSDRRFATSTGALSHNGQANISTMPYATAMSCDWGGSGRANVDLRGTPFKLPADYFVTSGFSQLGAASYSFVDQVVSITGGGYCGWTAPLGADPALGGALPLFYAAPPVAWTPVARVYPSGGAEPSAQALQPGWYDQHQLTVGNDTISSVHVPRGWAVTLYEHSRFSGSSITFTSDTLLTGNGWDKRASSIKVEAPVSVYSQHNFGGVRQSLRAGRYDINQLTLGNDTLRSLKVPDGFQVTLYADSGFSGQRIVLAQDTDLTGSLLNAVTSSLVVESTTSRNNNILHGQWLASGGQSRTSPANRQFLVEHSGPPDIVTFDLDANNAGPYLYLLDSSGNVLAEANDLLGGSRARIAYDLQPGSYKLVAATTQAGQTADFTLRSDKARLRYPLRLSVQAETHFDWVYDDHNTGAHDNISVWRPRLDRFPGHYSLGDVAMPSHGSPPRMTFVVSGEGDVLAPPIDYDLVWDDKHTRGSHDASFWHPRPAPGYTCLGSVATLGYDKPSTQLIRCVRSEYVLPASPAWLWDDRGSSAYRDGTVFQANATDHRSLTASSMVGQVGYGAANASLFWALNKSALANAELQGAPVDDLTVLQYAPLVWLHPDEYYWPSSAEFFLANVTPVGYFMETREPLGCASCTDPAFLHGQRPDPTTHVPMYAQIIPRTQAGAPTQTTDVVYWMFYPYNGGKRVCVGFYNAVHSCLGKFSTFGNHVGDWEHVTVRFVDGRPTHVFMAQHAEGQLFVYGDKALGLLNFHPETYVAFGSHGAYPDTGSHVYKTLFNGELLSDETGRGTPWIGWDRPVIIPWQPLGTYTSTNGPAWMDSILQWGNPPDGCLNIVTQYSNECIRNGGPSGPMLKTIANPEAMVME